MLDRLKSVEDEFVSLEASLSDPDLASDPDRLRDVSRRYKDSSRWSPAFVDIDRATADADAARELLIVATDDERRSSRSSSTTQTEISPRWRKSCAC